ncbi:hypothetical protein [Nocardia australiensis]|uniref:hypothetical protein n=1 Tax=Nocardia australiensis TaxID=2887191 RepID=UPI001D150D3B|nr:hypothetical protein [Nocardia australiensis]
MPTDHDGPGVPTNGDHYRDHVTTHPCVFVLSATTLVIGLVLLSWLGAGLPGTPGLDP